MRPGYLLTREFLRLPTPPGVRLLPTRIPPSWMLLSAALMGILGAGRSCAQTAVTTTAPEANQFAIFANTNGDIEKGSIFQYDVNGFNTGTVLVQAKLFALGNIQTAQQFQSNSGFSTIVDAPAGGIHGAPYYGIGQTDLYYDNPVDPNNPTANRTGATQLAGFFGLNFQVPGGQMVMRQNGNFGINTNAPSEKLEVNGNLKLSGAVKFPDGTAQTTAFVPGSALYSSSLATSWYAEQGEAVGISMDNQYGGGNGSVGILFQNQGHPAAQIVAAQSNQVNNPQGDLSFQTSNGSNLFEVMRLLHTGNAGIGTSTPSEKLEVNGNIKLSGDTGAHILFVDGSKQSMAWTGVIPPQNGGDFAESVDVTGPRGSFEPGDLLVIDVEHPGTFLKSSEPYSTLVGGVFATKPGFIGRRQPKESVGNAEVPMAMVGIVPTKVSAENGPIKVGDLLVSSSRAGYAMKGTDRALMVGATVGKALGPLSGGDGTIEVLISLQ